MVKSTFYYLYALVMFCSVMPLYSMDQGTSTADDTAESLSLRQQRNLARVDAEKKALKKEKKARVEAAARGTLPRQAKRSTGTGKIKPRRMAPALIAVAGVAVWIAYEGYKRKIRPYLQYQQDEHLLEE
ncbi:hypothetical protein JW872_03560 [Candidatus Babeliales bacterium]|nr:hypothetical protein [Candidatus Babeliales bacterium]